MDEEEFDDLFPDFWERDLEDDEDYWDEQEDDENEEEDE